MRNNQQSSATRQTHGHKPDFPDGVEGIIDRQRQGVGENRRYFLKGNAMLPGILPGLLPVPLDNQAHWRLTIVTTGETREPWKSLSERLRKERPAFLHAGGAEGEGQKPMRRGF